ncbi:MAG TPA: chorismate mutase [Stellaceae bacterium]|nr:chorismate mutase [Stellaceae bacterium]
MSSTPADLEGLRRRLDEIDDGLQQLLIERADIVSLVAASKRHDGALAAFQPAREAEILRRLAARHRGPFPLATLLRMWREMLAATVRMQSPFAVAAFAPPGSPGFWDLARDHYGSNTPMTPYGSASQVIRAVSEGGAAVGVLPMPQEADPDPWWRHLLSNEPNAPRVVGRLPFGARGNARSEGADALAIGRFVQQPTGADRTLFITETAEHISRTRIFGILAALPLTCSFFATFDHAEGAIGLVEVEGFVPLADPRLDGFREQLGQALTQLLPFGGYAVPLAAAALKG